MIKKTNLEQYIAERTRQKATSRPSRYATRR